MNTIRFSPFSGFSMLLRSPTGSSPTFTRGVYGVAQSSPQSTRSNYSSKYDSKSLSSGESEPTLKLTQSARSMGYTDSELSELQHAMAMERALAGRKARRIALEQQTSSPQNLAASQSSITPQPISNSNQPSVEQLTETQQMIPETSEQDILSDTSETNGDTIENQLLTTNVNSAQPLEDTPNGQVGTSQTEGEDSEIGAPELRFRQAVDALQNVLNRYNLKQNKEHPAAERILSNIDRMLSKVDPERNSSRPIRSYEEATSIAESIGKKLRNNIGHATRIHNLGEEPVLKRHG